MRCSYPGCSEEHDEINRINFGLFQGIEFLCEEHFEVLA